MKLQNQGLKFLFVNKKITEEQDFDDKDKVCHHVMLKENGRVVAYSRIVPKGVGYENISIGRVLVLNSS